MKDGARHIVGKTISGIVISENTRSPRICFFITFSDGTYFEIYGDQFSCAAGVDAGGVEKAAGYAKRSGAKITATYL